MAYNNRTAQSKERFIEALQDAGIKDKRVLDVVADIPREIFVPASFQREAYENRALPIGDGQTISQPYIVALMTHALDVHRTHKVLEIGIGSGYQTAILCKLARRVYTIERFKSLANRAEETLRKMHIPNFVSKVGDGSLGWPEQAPFDRIIVTAAAPDVPKSLLEQLAPGGILVVPMGAQEDEQQLMRFYKRTDGTIGEYFMGYVRFVPLIGKEGLENPHSA